MAESPALRALTEELLADQGDLSAVARFSRWHEAHAEPAQARSYRDLIPLTKPQPGQQYAFDVDLDKCSGCKACVSACHSLNGLDDGEAWRDTGLLVSNDWRQPYQQTVTTACHHCVDPACLNGCPVLAYDKDPLTGIVRHLDDQCIGCQYCVLKCPYDVPKYSARRGIVRKCDLCSHRLAVGEAPACVQACPHEAIRITLVETKAVELSFRPAGEASHSESRGVTRGARVVPTRSRPVESDRPQNDRAHTELPDLLRLETSRAPESGVKAPAQVRRADFQSAASPSSIPQNVGTPKVGDFHAACGLEIRETTQRGQAATKTDRGCVVPTSRSTATFQPAAAGPEDTAAVRRSPRGLRRFLAILMEGNSVLRVEGFLPDAPAPDYTLPTTRYRTAKTIPASVRAADREELHPQPAHTPLVFMLVLSQLSVGLFLFELLLSLAAPADRVAAIRPAQARAALVAGLVAIAVSVGHLGRPLGAWRAFLNLQRSWLSREIVVFGLFLPLAALHTVAVWFPQVAPVGLRPALGIATVLSGLLGVFCSAMLYHDTRREFWRLSLTGGRFLGTTLLLGAAGTLLIFLAAAPAIASNFILALGGVMLVAAMLKLALDQRVFQHLADDDFSPLHKTALLLSGRFGLLTRCRAACTIAGGLVMPALLALQSVASTTETVPARNFTVQAAVAFVLCLASELIERRLFFTAVQPAKMPGVIAT